jgi:hypothetical protein
MILSMICPGREEMLPSSLSWLTIDLYFCHEGLSMGIFHHLTTSFPQNKQSERKKEYMTK